MSANKQQGGKSGNNPNPRTQDDHSKARDRMSGTHGEQDQPKQPMYSQDGRTPNPEKTADRAEKKENVENSDSTGQNTQNKNAEKTEQQSNATVVNEQDQNVVVNDRGDQFKGEQQEDETGSSSLNREDFPEADDSGEQPFRKVPTMDA